MLVAGASSAGRLILREFLLETDVLCNVGWAGGSVVLVWEELSSCQHHLLHHQPVRVSDPHVLASRV